jgi:hypothetical protein
VQVQPDVVPGDRGAVFFGAGDRDLEFAWQKRELGVQRAPLAQHLAVRPRVNDLVRRDACKRIGGDVADAIAAGLDAVHVDVGQDVHHVGRFTQRDPVELQVLPRREVAKTTALVGLAGILMVMLARDAGQCAELWARQLAIRHRHAQHRRMALHVPAVLQPQRAEVVIGQLPGEVALQLIAELRRALVHELAVEGGVLVHLKPSLSDRQ